jgi:hypothetical protein
VRPCPIRWYAGDRDADWAAKEIEIAATMKHWIGDYGAGTQARDIRFPNALAVNPRYLLGDLYLFMVRSPRLQNLLHHFGVVCDAMRGRSGAMTRIWTAILRRLSPGRC